MARRTASQRDLKRLLPGESELARRMRAFDWSKTDLGPPQTWPQNLKIAVDICLNSRFPMHVWWGPNLTLLYNDAYISFLGRNKHPQVLGRSGREAWFEIWDTIGPMIDNVLATGRASWSEDILMFFDRELSREEVYVTFSFSPVFGEGSRVDGLFCACTETTEKLVGNRRLDTLRKLGVRAAEAQSLVEACKAAADVLCENPCDIPFAAIYVVDEAQREARLAASTGGAEDDRLPLSRSLSEHDSLSPWPVAEVFWTKHPREMTDLEESGVRLSGGPWPEPARSALVLPIRAATHENLAGVLVAAVSPRRPLDAAYRAFFELVAGHVGTALANAMAYEEERRRAEALAEIDRVKTAFFSNVSHEFRTPLTLMLGPLEDLLATPDGQVQPPARAQIDLAHQNGLRLLKLVNTLLDFSRLEAGRVQASYRPTELAALTAELASTFRSAIEKAGLRLAVQCPPLKQPVFVDRDMWEKVVLNLISNALKFTFEGEIGVAVGRSPDGLAAELRVRDTGMGIEAADLPRLFERFHRVRGARGRTYEGTGIGLALVHEIAKLHGARVSVESQPGRGSTFTVRIPFGSAHLPSEQVVSTPAPAVRHAEAYVEEALRWFPGNPSPSVGILPDRELVSGAPARKSRVLLADDNADMRDYVRRILGPTYQVSAVANGRQALELALGDPPDLVLSDIMMSELDGFGLLAALRAHPKTSTLPVILLSARAGEESRVEGLTAGADDYLVKPFSARELLARVASHLELSRHRRETEERLRASLAEKEVLLREIHHRVKNNLEVVKSLLSLQSDFVDDPAARKVLAQTSNRVGAIARIHRLLYRSPDMARVDVGAFLQQLAENLFSFYGIDSERVRLDLQVGQTLIDIEQALPFGLILNELLCNTFKYAFPENQRGTVTVKIDESAGLLVVADDGAGLPAALDPKSSPSLGLQLVHMLVEQLGGTIAVESGRGTRITIKFPAKELDPPLLPSRAGPKPIEAPRESPPAQTV